MSADSMHDGGYAGDKPKVFGIGLSRTGTTSLTHALTILGYRTNHFPHDDDFRREVTDYLEQDADRLELSVLRHYDALTDLPICCIYQGLDCAYPGSRFILTSRDKETWLESAKRLWDQIGAPVLMSSPDAVEAQFATYIARKLEERAIGRSINSENDEPTFDRELMSRFFDAYHADVREYFKDRPEQLLELKIVEGEGWEKLAPFLNEPIPSEAFPFEMRLKRRGADGEKLEGDATEADVEIVRQYIDAFKRRDLDACQAFFADDALVKFMAKRFQGKQAIADWHRERFQANVQILDSGTIEAVGDAVVAELTVTSKLTKRWRVSLGGQSVIRIEDAKIREMGFEGVRLIREGRFGLFRRS